MKRTIVPVTLEVNEQGGSMDIEVPSPGIVRQTLLQMQKTAISLLSPAPGKEMVKLVPTILFEIDPLAEEQTRTFHVMPMGQAIESAYQLEYRGSFLYPNGLILFLYEEIGVPVAKQLSPPSIIV